MCLPKGKIDSGVVDGAAVLGGWETEREGDGERESENKGQRQKTIDQYTVSHTRKNTR